MPIDFTVVDTHLGSKESEQSSPETNIFAAMVPKPSQSTISRFACRILIGRNAPYEARVFAAGFDVSRNIFLGVCVVIAEAIFIVSISFYIA